MKHETAKVVLDGVHRSGEALGHALDAIRDACGRDEFIRHRDGFAAAYESLGVILNTIHAEHPDLDIHGVTIPYLNKYLTKKKPQGDA